MLIDEQVDVRIDGEPIGKPAGDIAALVRGAAETEVDLGIWLSGLDSFLSAGQQAFGVLGQKHTSEPNQYIRLIHAGLQRSLMLASQAVSVAVLKRGGGDAAPRTDLIATQRTLREALAVSDAMLRGGGSSSADAAAWMSMLASRLRSTPSVSRLILASERAGGEYLPPLLAELSATNRFLTIEQSELALVLPMFGRVLRWLAVVGRMLERDEPLKPALILFSRINEQVVGLSEYINNRISQFADHEAELFSTLDAASYTASIELKKVYFQELAGIPQMRPTPTIFARMETAYALLNESFQQTLAGFAKIVDPAADILDLFPSFSVKRDQSKKLRSELRLLVHVVQSAERTPESREIETLHTAVRDFMAESASYLFFKDTETVERFVEEILITKQNKDLVPILHRFGAYLETLFGQVCLRAVLAAEAFDPDVIS